MLRALESLPEAWLDRDLTFQLCSQVLNSSQSHSHWAIFNSKPCSQISSSQFLCHSASALFNTSPYSHCFHPKVLSTKQFLISFIVIKKSKTASTSVISIYSHSHHQKVLNSSQYHSHSHHKELANLQHHFSSPKRSQQFSVKFSHVVITKYLKDNIRSSS